jgi:mono/diheme cytochrome c family protein
MKCSKRLAIAASAAAAFCLGASALLQAQDSPPGDAGNGKRVYLADGCFTCHGRSGQGGAFKGPAPSLAKTEMPFDGFKAQLREPANDMPAYSRPCCRTRTSQTCTPSCNRCPAARVRQRTFRF